MKICVVCESELNGQKKMYCSNKCKQKHHWYRLKEQTNTYHSQTIRAYKRKIKLIEMMGGSCINCGYSGNLAALEFHHKNPGDKEVKLDLRILSNRSWDYILTESKKCELLCSNCHREEHNPELTLENIMLLLKEHKN